jgi:hypothetical protein
MERIARQPQPAGSLPLIPLGVPLVIFKIPDVSVDYRLVAFRICRFSAFFSSAALEKLKEPEIRVLRSIMMILLWAMAWAESI